ncbi:uncharacterized protein LOC144453386 isoform X2 [Glandiceps talaboti]
MTKKDETRTGLNFIKSPDKLLQDIMEDDAKSDDDLADNQPGEICISSISTDSSDRDDRTDNVEVCTNSEKTTTNSPIDKGKRRVRFSLPGMGGKCIYPARVEEDYRRYRRYSSPSLFGDANYPYEEESRSDSYAEQNEICSRRKRKTSLPPINNYTVETFYERQVESVDGIASTLMSRDFVKPSPRVDSPAKSSFGSAHFQAAMSIPLSDDEDSNNNNDDGDDCEQKCNVNKTVPTHRPHLSSPPTSPNNQPLSPSSSTASLKTLDPPRPSTPRRRRMGVVQTTPPVFKSMESLSETHDRPPTPRKDLTKTGTPPSNMSLGLTEQSNGRGTPDARSPRSSVGTPPIVRSPTPRLLKRRAISLGQTAKPDPSALQTMPKSSSFPNETSKNNNTREHDIKVLERKLQSVEVRKKEVKTQNYISETISQILPVVDKQRQFRVRRKSLPSTMPPSPVFIPPEIDFSSLENCRYLRRKPSDEDLDDMF